MTQSPFALSMPSAPCEEENDACLNLLDVTPETLYVYWRLHWWQVQAARKSLGTEAPLVARIHDLAYMDTSGANPHATLEWHVHALVAGCYVQVPGGDRLLVGEMGLRLPNRHLLLIVRTKPLRMPLTSAASVVRPRHPGQSHAIIKNFPQLMVPPCHALPFIAPPAEYRPHPALVSLNESQAQEKLGGLHHDSSWF